jgi:hypothetical protein
MPDPIVIALIAAVGGIAGGIITAIVQPFGQDYVASRAEQRAETRAKEQRERDAQARAAQDRLESLRRVSDALSGMSEGGLVSDQTVTRWRALPTEVAAIGDERLNTAIGALLSEPRGSTGWRAAHGEASRRVGELIREAHNLAISATPRP